jgi:hypothetical protein
VTALDDAARMAAGIAAINRNAASLAHDEIGHGAPPPPAEIANRPGRAERLLGLSVACPFCRAAAGQPCHAHRRGRPECAPHPRRLDAARAASNLSAAAVAAAPVAPSEKGERS